MTIFAFSAQHALYLRQIDYVAAFLNGVMDHEVYIAQPEGFAIPGQEHMVRKLNKAIYGTRQGAERWYKTPFGR